VKPKFDNNRDRFVSSAEKRTNKVLNALKVLSGCSNKSLYEYKSKEIDKIFEAIEEGAKLAKLRFKKKTVRFYLGVVK